MDALADAVVGVCGDGGIAGEWTNDVATDRRFAARADGLGASGGRVHSHVILCRKGLSLRTRVRGSIGLDCKAIK